MTQAPGSPIDRYRVGDLILDVRRRQVTRRGRPLKLGKLTFDLLRALAESAPAVLTRDELASLVWAGRVVSLETVSQRVKLLREALSDDAHHPRYIGVVRGQGVMLIPPVKPLPSESSRSRWRRGLVPATSSLLVATLLGSAYWQFLAPEEPADASELNTLAEAFYSRGKAYEQGGDDPLLSVQQYERAVEEDPEFALAWAALADAYSDAARRAQPDEASRLRGLAKEAAEETVELSPGLPEARIAMAGVYAREGNYPAAFGEYAAAERANPKNALIYKQRALMRANLGQFENAVRDFDRSIAWDPGDPHAHQQQGISYAQLRDYDRAVEAFDRVLDFAPDHRYAGWKVLALHAAGDLAGMKAAIEEAYELRNSQRWAWDWAFYARDGASALDHLANWREGEGFSKNWRYAMTYLFLLGMPSRAEPYLQAARDDLVRELREDPNDPWNLASLVEVTAYLDERDEATNYAREALALLEETTRPMTNAELRLEILWGLIALNDYDSAIENLSTYLSNPGTWSIEGIRLDPRLEPLLDDERFLALVNQHKRQ